MSTHGRRRDGSRPVQRGSLLPGVPLGPAGLGLLAALALAGAVGMGSSRVGQAWAGLPIEGWRSDLLRGELELAASSAIGVLCSVAALIHAVASTRQQGREQRRMRVGMSLGLLLCALAGLLSGVHDGRATLWVDGLALTGLITAAGALLGGSRSAGTMSWPRLRLMLDGMAVGGAFGFAYWQAWLVQTDGRQRADALEYCLLLTAVVSVLAVVALGSLREVRVGLWPVVVGLALHLGGSLLFLHEYAVTGATSFQPVGFALWCTGWGLMAVGVARAHPAVAVPAAVLDRYEAASSQLAALLVVALTLIGILARGAQQPDVVALVLLGEVLALMCLRECVDAVQQLRLTADLRRQARLDLLTGMPNRRALTERIAELEARRDDWVVLTVDIDRFKEINDLFGHRAGDDLLVTVGRELSAAMPAQAMVARIGGDEFAVLAPGDLDVGRRLAVTLQAQLREALRTALPGSAPTASVGVGRLESGEGQTLPVRRRLNPGPAPEAERRELFALVQSAAALRAAKAAGPASVQVYAGQVAADRERRVALESRLRSAVASGRIRTVAQPIADLATGEIYGFEALARWRDSELGEIPPAEFVAIAEENGLVVELGRHVLENSIEAAAAAGVFAVGASLSINVSPIQLRVPGLVPTLRDQIERHRVPPELIVVEVTEAILVTEDDPALQTLGELNAIGVRAAIDDFGTGYSAIGYLRRLPVQVLKIDMSLTRSLLTEPRTVAIVEGLVRMAHRMDIRVVMEGIETELEAQRCRTLEADLGQGWLFGRPTEWVQVADALAAVSAHPRDAVAPVAPSSQFPAASVPPPRPSADASTVTGSR